MNMPDTPTMPPQPDDLGQSANQPPASRYAGQDLARPGYTNPADRPAGQESLAWQAAEYQQQFKGPGWVAGLVVVAGALFAVAYLTGAWTFMALVVVMAVTVGVFAFRKPRLLRYAINAQGVQIEDKTYSYHDFRAFGVVPSEGVYSAVLLPSKRFGLAVRLYFGQDIGGQVVDILGSHLPMQDMREDPLDKVMSRLRF